MGPTVNKYLKISVLLVACSTILVSGYKYHKWFVQERTLNNKAAVGRSELMQCQESLSKLKVVPLIGGGYLHVERVQGLTTDLQDGECGVNGFSTRFWWTGENIIPDHGANSDHGNPPPSTWMLFNVTAGFSRTYNREHQAKLNYKSDGDQSLVANQVIPLNHYPGLEFRLIDHPPSDQNSQALGMVYSSENGSNLGQRRLILCQFNNAHNNNNRQGETILHTLSRLHEKELEDIDLTDTRAPCVANFSTAVSGRSQGARVSFTSGDLQAAIPALNAIENYILESIGEDEQ
jgi:hypothetical protein